jgi:hypothetical protein
MTWTPNIPPLVNSFTRATVDGILGPRFTWREDPSGYVLHVRPPADMTDDDRERLAALHKAKPLPLAIELEGGPYR